MQIAHPAPGLCLIRPALRLAIAAVLLVGASAAFAEVVVDEERRSYILDGASSAELAVQLETHRAMPSDGEPASSHGLTEVGIEARYELEPRVDGRCVLQRIRVHVHIVQTLPEWKPTHPTSPELGDEVKRMLRGLAVHEAGHRRHGIEAAGAVERRLLALPPAEDCRRARRAAARVLAREVIRLQVRAYNYDLATGNGRTQGAVLQEHRVAPRPSGSRVRRRYAPEEPVHRPEPR
ncbi:MAG: DUF922 domain-containing Zn-dependent protease [Chiayiivirga sp.]|jgi:predicted secreted Zn-dependent protease|nr:DUF922 domain-containing Zn-dependent protease [Chiayiivirga sp.]